jgi:hypothetical protein
LKTAHYILYVTLPALFFSCAKQAPQPNAAVLVPGPTPKVDYRDKFIGTYQGRNTDWQNVQGVTTTWIDGCLYQINGTGFGDHFTMAGKFYHKQHGNFGEAELDELSNLNFQGRQCILFLF